MSHSTDIFVGTEASRDEIVAVLKSGLGVPVQRSTDEGTPYLRAGEAAVHIGDHDFFEFYKTDGGTIPLETEYPYWIEVRDAQRDIDRQRSAGQHVFEILKRTGRWRVLYIDNFELVADSYDPTEVESP